MSLRQRLADARQAEAELEHRHRLALIQGHVHHQVVVRLAEDQPGSPLVAYSGVPRNDPLRHKVASLAEQLLEAGYPDLTPAERAGIVAGVCDDVFAFGPLTPLLQDPDVTEIMVNGPGVIYAEHKGRIVKTPQFFRDTRHLTAVIEKILAPLGRRVDESRPMVDARLPDGSRINVIIPPICLHGPAVTVRKFREDTMTLDDLEHYGSLTAEIARFLRCCVESRRNIIVAGGTASGKTTLLGALSAFVPDDERIITVEDAAELRLRQGHVLSLEARPPNVEGKGAVSIRDLLRNALRMRPDRIVVGEVRGPEALDLLQAMNTGHDGCLSTLHANSPRDALARLETMALMAQLQLPARVVREQVAAAVHILVQLERFEDGTRRVVRIVEVHGMDGENIALQDVFSFERSGVTAQGRVRGDFVASATPPASLAEFQRFGLPSRCWRPPPRDDG